MVTPNRSGGGPSKETPSGSSQRRSFSPITLRSQRRAITGNGGWKASSNEHRTTSGVVNGSMDPPPSHGIRPYPCRRGDSEEKASLSRRTGGMPNGGRDGGACIVAGILPLPKLRPGWFVSRQNPLEDP